MKLFEEAYICMYIYISSYFIRDYIIATVATARISRGIIYECMYI